MRMLHGIERRLQGAVDKTFARIFGGSVQPAEVTSALQREAAGNVRHQDGRAIAPNRFIVQLGPSDHADVGDDVRRVSSAFTDMLANYVADQGWETFADVDVSLQESDLLHTGQFRITSLVDPDVGRHRGSGSVPAGEPGLMDQFFGRPAAPPRAPIASPVLPGAPRSATAYDAVRGHAPIARREPPNPIPPQLDHGSPAPYGARPADPVYPAVVYGSQAAADDRPVDDRQASYPLAGSWPNPDADSYGDRYPPPGADSYGSRAAHGEAAGYPPPVVSPRLLVQDGSGRSYPLQRGSNVIGRGADAALRLADTSVSRRHIDVYFDGQVAIVHDLGSTNGTNVNGSPVQTWQLADGDEIRIGQSAVVFRSR
ncbi:MAG: hypothetical protein BGO26_20755 [Actinobacteria bacterium 69-20]|nr:MAG: hypothetical protein BGO26_20755 [Actinobacteria bacterium 69-20]